MHGPKIRVSYVSDDILPAKNPSGAQLASHTLRADQPRAGSVSADVADMKLELPRLVCGFPKTPYVNPSRSIILASVFDKIAQVFAETGRLATIEHPLQGIRRWYDVV